MYLTPDPRLSFYQERKMISSIFGAQFVIKWEFI